MEQISLKAIREWVRFLRGADKVNFSTLGMKDMMTLIEIPIRIEFLKAAAGFWNPFRHTFVFGSQELCPTIEEFAAISGIQVSGTPILPRPRLGYLAELKKLCSGSERQNGALIHGPSVDIMGLIRRFKDRVHPDDSAFMKYRRSALCLCIFAGFLLRSEERRVGKECRL